MEGGTNSYSHADSIHVNETPNTSTTYAELISSVPDRLLNMPTVNDWNTYEKTKYQADLYGNVYNVPQFPPSTMAASPKSPPIYLIPNEAEQATENVSFMTYLNDANYKEPLDVMNNLSEESSLKLSQEGAGTSSYLRGMYSPLELPQSPSGALTTQLFCTTGQAAQEAAGTSSHLRDMHIPLELPQSYSTSQAAPERVPSMLGYKYTEDKYLTDVDKIVNKAINDVPLKVFPSTSTSNGAIHATTSVKLPYKKEWIAHVENTYPIDVRNSFMTVTSGSSEIHNIPSVSIPGTLHASTTTPRLTSVISNEAAHTPMGNALNTGTLFGFEEDQHPVNIQVKSANPKSILRPKQQVTGLTNLNRMYNPLTIQIPGTSTTFSTAQTHPVKKILLMNSRKDFAENKNPVYLQDNIVNGAFTFRQTPGETSQVEGIQNQNHNLFHPNIPPIKKTLGTKGAVQFIPSVIHPPVISMRNAACTLNNNNNNNNEYAENKYPIIFPNNVHNAKPISKYKRKIPVSTASNAMHLANITPVLPGTSTAASALTETTRTKNEAMGNPQVNAVAVPNDPERRPNTFRAITVNLAKPVVSDNGTALTETTRTAQAHSLGKVPPVKIVIKNKPIGTLRVGAAVAPNDPQPRQSTSRAIIVNVAKQVVNNNDGPFRVFSIKKDLLKSSEEFKTAANNFRKAMQHAKANSNRKRKHEEPEVIDLEPNISLNANETACMLCFQQVQVGQDVTLQQCHHKFCKKCFLNFVQSSNDAVMKCPVKLHDGFCDSSLQNKDIVNHVPAEVYATYIQRCTVPYNPPQPSSEINFKKFFVCSTPDCYGWFFLQDDVHTYQCPICKQTNCIECFAVHEGKTCEQYRRDYNQREYQEQLKQEYEGKGSYQHLLALDSIDLVANTDKFDCPICFQEIDVGQGATLRDCLHNFCKECLAGAIEHSETATVKCPFQNDEYSCESCLQEREVKALVSQEVYDKYLHRSVALAESQAQNSFHCKTPDCPGWCLFEDGVNTFRCPACCHINCLTCAAIHEGMNCLQYQDDVAFRSATDEDAKRTRDYLQSMVNNGDAMRCPQCKVILMKMEGCDWLKCSMCQTEVCWVTKGTRWGPMGNGDTSGGCRCKVNGIRCHPNCKNCH